MSERFLVSRGCIICGSENPVGMHAQYEHTDEGAQTIVTPGEQFQGFDGVLQGGIITGLMDDAMWYAVLAQGVVSMTAELTVRFKRPVPVNQRLTVRGKVVERRRSLFICEASIENDSGDVLATAQAKFMTAPESVRTAVDVTTAEDRGAEDRGAEVRGEEARGAE